jgi:oxygen-dependent protoporphyrinogen oxidase
MPGRRLFSWRDGMGSLPRALAAQLGPVVRTGVAVRRILPHSRGFRVDAGAAGSLEARAVVIATQPHVTAALLEGLDAQAAAAAAAIEAPPLAVVFLGYHRRQVAHPLDGLGYLTPAAEGRALTGALFCSTMFAGRAPEHHVALAGYIGGSRAPDLARLPRDEVVDLARAEFKDLIGARGEPVVARVRQWPQGLPQYRPGHDQRIRVLTAGEHRKPGVFVTGNYLRGVSVAACLDQAAETAALVHEYLPDLASEASAPHRPGWRPHDTLGRPAFG